MFIVYKITNGTIMMTCWWQIRIQARDLGQPAKFAYKTCEVGIEQNFRDPYFLEASYRGSIQNCESFPLGSTVLTVSGRDDDVAVSSLKWFKIFTLCQLLVDIFGKNRHFAPWLVSFEWKTLIVLCCTWCWDILPDIAKFWRSFTV